MENGGSGGGHHSLDGNAEKSVISRIPFFIIPYSLPTCVHQRIKKIIRLFVLARPLPDITHKYKQRRKIETDSLINFWIFFLRAQIKTILCLIRGENRQWKIPRKALVCKDVCKLSADSSYRLSGVHFYSSFPYKMWMKKREKYQFEYPCLKWTHRLLLSSFCWFRFWWDSKLSQFIERFISDSWNMKNSK